MVGLRTYGRRLSNDTSSPGGAIYDVVNDSDLGRRLNDAMRGGGEHPALYASRTAADQWNVLPSLPYRTYTPASSAAPPSSRLHFESLISSS